MYLEPNKATFWREKSDKRLNASLERHQHYMVSTVQLSSTTTFLTTSLKQVPLQEAAFTAGE